ncbi:MAG: Clp protease N-terminal domain-containing protein, partial [Candidatus Roizmanbacteria bacterium]|nr:Clp protease N-terminal domain-containing protein [Candidatus Roizmanbacteria bacterium]
MADYFDFIKKPVTNATPNQNLPSTVNPPVSVNEPVKPKNQSPVTINKSSAFVKAPADKQTTNNLDLMTHLTQRSNRVMMAAQTKAKELKGDLVDSEHLLYGLTTDSEIYNLLVETKIQPQLVLDELNKVYKRGTVDRVVQFSPRIKKILNDALVIARKLGFEFIAPEHLLLSLFEEGEGVGARVLVKLGL